MRENNNLLKRSLKFFKCPHTHTHTVVNLKCVLFVLITSWCQNSDTAVSYTHLDVYKRQELPCMKTGTNFCCCRLKLCITYYIMLHEIDQLNDSDLNFRI